VRFNIGHEPPVSRTTRWTTSELPVSFASAVGIIAFPPVISAADNYQLKL
jgi:hypothetical protein